MEENKQRFCDIMRFYVNEVYREGIANDWTYQKSFMRFSDRNCSLKKIHGRV